MCLSVIDDTKIENKEYPSISKLPKRGKYRLKADYRTTKDYFPSLAYRAVANQASGT